MKLLNSRAVYPVIHQRATKVNAHLHLKYHKIHVVHYPLPWPRNDSYENESYFGAILGQVLLGASLRAHTDGKHKWSEKEFLVGAKHAVNEFASILGSPNRHDELEDITSEELCTCIKASLEKLKSGCELGLHLHDIKKLKVAIIRTVAGAAPLGQEHVIYKWGHKVITHQETMDTIAKEMDKSGFTLQHLQNVGKHAVSQKLEFQICVDFKTSETYWLTNQDGAIIEGSKEHPVKCNHRWVFSSTLNDSDYPFSWIITDINNFIKAKSNR